MTGRSEGGEFLTIGHGGLLGAGSAEFWAHYLLFQPVEPCQDARRRARR